MHELRLWRYPLTRAPMSSYPDGVVIRDIGARRRIQSDRSIFNRVRTKQMPWPRPGVSPEIPINTRCLRPNRGAVERVPGHDFRAQVAIGKWIPRTCSGMRRYRSSGKWVSVKEFLRRRMEMQ